MLSKLGENYLKREQFVAATKLHHLVIGAMNFTYHKDPESTPHSVCISTPSVESLVESIAVVKRELNDADNAFSRCIAVSKEEFRKDPNNHDIQEALASCNIGLGNVAFHRFKLSAFVTHSTRLMREFEMRSSPPPRGMQGTFCDSKALSKEASSISDQLEVLKFAAKNYTTGIGLLLKRFGPRRDSSQQLSLIPITLNNVKIMIEPNQINENEAEITYSEGFKVINKLALLNSNEPVLRYYLSALYCKLADISEKNNQDIHFDLYLKFASEILPTKDGALIHLPGEETLIEYLDECSKKFYK